MLDRGFWEKQMLPFDPPRRSSRLAPTLALVLGASLVSPDPAAGSVDCSRFLGSTQSGPQGVGQLVSIDPRTAQTVVVGDFSATSLATEVEYDPTSDAVYASEFAGLSHLHVVDPQTAQSLNAIEHAFGNLTGLELVSGQLYGAFSPGQGPTPSSLVVVDRSTGAFTTIGPTGFGPLSGLAHHTVSGVLYGITGGAGTAKLVNVDFATGAATVVGDTGLDKVGSIEFGPDGELYGGTTDTATRFPTYLFRIDTATAQIELIGPTGVSITGLTGCPAPADTDGDGVNDADDACPLSDLNPTVVVGQCVSTAENGIFDNGCSINDEIAKCLPHPGFGIPHCLSKVVRRAYKTGLIDADEAWSILGCSTGP